MAMMSGTGVTSYKGVASGGSEIDSQSIRWGQKCQGFAGCFGGFPQASWGREAVEAVKDFW